MKLIKTSFYSAIITVLRTLSGFVSSKFVAVYVGPAGMALVGQFINFITVTLTFANGAINNGVVKYTAEYDGDTNKLKALFSTSLKISIACSAVAGIIVVIWASQISSWIFQTSAHSGPVRVFGLGIVFYSLNTLLISIVNGLKQIRIYTIVNIIGTLVGLGFTIVLIIFYKVDGALYALSLSQSLVFFVTAFLIIKSPWFNKSYFTQKFSQLLFRKLSVFSLMAIVSAITLPLAQLYLRNYVAMKFGLESAGYWQGMMRISDAYLMVVTTALSTYYLPKLSSLKDNLELRKEIFYGYKIILPAVAGICLLIYLFRFLIIHLLYTKEFLPMEDLFFYQLLGDFFKIAAWILAYLMLAKAMLKVYIITEIVFTVTYILLSVLFIYLVGVKGIVIAFAVNYGVYLIVMLIIFNKLLFGKSLK